MATIVFSAVGAAVGSGVGGGVLGLSSAVIGRAVGATLGQVVDRRLLGQGAEPVATGRIDRLRLVGAAEGAALGRVYGRLRVAGQVIWASRFREEVVVSGGGKGSTPSTREFRYSVSVAIALCEGEIVRVGRIWADGREISSDDISMRVYHGTEDQLPDPKIVAVEGADNAPAYRGIAYVVIEDLDITAFGNRVPQFNFEVFRRPRTEPGGVPSAPELVQAVAMVPGTGEYTLATTRVHYVKGPGQNEAANVHVPTAGTDFTQSVRQLTEELPACKAASLVVSWFGDDLRCGNCAIRPMVEDASTEGVPMPWRAGGVDRGAAAVVPRQDGRPVYGGTPADASVIEAIRHMNAAGLQVMFYPFILMTQLAGNGLPDPWGGDEQPALPWRGRITGSVAPGRAGTVDGTPTAEAEVAAFFGTASPSDFVVTGERVDYVGPAEWSYRRFVLHYAHLFKLAGGEGAFCIGSELRGLTQLRGAGGTFPAVAALRALAADVRQILGPDVRIGYAADWSEYFGYRPEDGSGDVYFHLDPLWADPEIDFIGIDNYMPLSDWRDGFEHEDAEWGAIYDLEYLKSNIEGGEGYDWYYATEDARNRQVRTPIRDDAHGEDWIFRYKDIRNWWKNLHHERIGGVRSATPTAWVPASKPIWFTEIGCPAVDKGTNAPNRFLDLRSSESGLPPFSTGRRDDLVQAQYLRATMDYWADPAVNPVSELYGGPMVDTSRIFVWAWDARPHPAFPAMSDTWSDGPNYYRGHWLNGRTGWVPLSATVAEICRQAGVEDIDTSRLHGLVRGYQIERAESARASLQPLMLAHGFEAVERDGMLVFKPRDRAAAMVISPDGLAVGPDGTAQVARTRASEAEVTGRLRLTHVEADGDYRTRVAEALPVAGQTETVSESELPLALTQSEAQAVAARWLADARIARETVTLALPPSATEVEPGALVAFEEAPERLYRVERMEEAGLRRIEASRVEPATIEPGDAAEDAIVIRPFRAPVPVLPVFLDLPLVTGDEVPHAPHLAVAARPWPGSVAVWDSAMDADYRPNIRLQRPARIGTTETPMPPGQPGVWQRGPRLLVRLNGTLSAADEAAVLSGANVAAIGDGSAENWELFQFSGASLVDDGLWELTGFLRGQAGTEGLAAGGWPKGSTFVLLDGAPAQISLAPAARGLQRHYRIGPANRGYDDPSFVHRVEAFRGIGLRPYAPCHLRVARTAQGELAFSWIRRTRIDGDGWEAPDVPLGEETEAYQLRLEKDGALVRELVVSAPRWTYDLALQLADGASGTMSLSVAQISARFGAGPATRISFDV